MTTVPSGEDKATSNSPHDPPKASLDNKADDGSTDSSAGGSQSPDSVADDGEASSSTATSTQGLDVDQSSFETAASEAQPTSGDKDENAGAPGDSQERPEEITSLLPQDPRTLQVFVGFQNPVWDRLAENTRTTQSRTVSPSDSQVGKETSEEASVPKGQPELAPPTPNAEVQSTQHDEVQPSVDTADPSTADASGQLGPRATSITEAATQEAEDPEALNPDSEAGSLMEAGQNLEASSRGWEASSSPPSPAGSAPPSPGPGRGLLDSNLYGAHEENDYMRSMTSLLGGGEGAISSLSDVLVWSDATMGMGVALSFLASDYGSPTEVLHSPGPSLRSVSSILASARSAFSSGLAAGTGSALRSMTHVLERMERRTVDSIRSAVRYLTDHLTPRRVQPDPSCD